MLASQPHHLVVCVGTAGDIHPFMRLALTLQSLGRQVTFITNTFHAGLLKDSGLPFVGLGTDAEYLRIVQNPDVWDQKKGFATLLANYEAQLAQIDAAMRSVVRDEPSVVIAHPLVVPAAVMAREQGLVQAVVGCYLAPSTLRTCHGEVRLGPTKVPDWFPLSWRRTLWRFTEKGWIDPVGLKHINARRSALALPPVTDSFLGHMENAPDLLVTLFPTWFGPTMPDWPKHLLEGDFPLFDPQPPERFSPELSAFLAAGEPPLVFTPGTGNLHAAAFFKCALSAATQLGRRAIFLTKERAQVPAQLPDSVLWQPYVPLSGLLSRAAALVHHGGIGTTAEALRAGVPQLVVPFGWDQHDNGARVKNLGLGDVIHASRLRPDKLAKVLQALTGSAGVQSQCKRVAERFDPRQDLVAHCLAMEQRVLDRPVARRSCTPLQGRHGHPGRLGEPNAITSDRQTHE